MPFLILLFETHCFIAESKTASGGCQNKKEIVMLASHDFFWFRPMIIACLISQIA